MELNMYVSPGSNGKKRDVKAAEKGNQQEQMET